MVIDDGAIYVVDMIHRKHDLLRTLRASTTVLVMAGIAAGCGKGEKAESAAKASPEATRTAPTPASATTTPAAAPPPAPAATADPQLPAIGTPKGLFDCNKGDRPPPSGAAATALPFALSACPTIPSIFGDVSWGMDVPTALKAAKAKQVEGYRGAVEGEVKLGRSRFTLRFTDVGQLNEIAFITNQAAVDAMTAAWGPPLEVEDLGDKNLLWFNAAQGTRVVAKPSLDKYHVTYFAYVSIATLFAADGLLSKPIIGESAAKVAELVPTLLKIESKDDATKRIAALNLDERTAAIAAWSGTGDGGADLILLGLPTESTVKLGLKFEDGKLKEYGALIDTRGNKVLRDEYAAQFVAALGAPTAESTFEFGEPHYVFAAPGGHKVRLHGGDEWFFDVTK